MGAVTKAAKPKVVSLGEERELRAFAEDEREAEESVKSPHCPTCLQPTRASTRPRALSPLARALFTIAHDLTGYANALDAGTLTEKALPADVRRMLRTREQIAPDHAGAHEHIERARFVKRLLEELAPHIKAHDALRDKDRGETLRAQRARWFRDRYAARFPIADDAKVTERFLAAVRAWNAFHGKRGGRPRRGSEGGWVEPFRRLMVVLGVDLSMSSDKIREL